MATKSSTPEKANTRPLHLFVGSSSQNLVLAKAILQNIDSEEIEVVLWQHAFTMGGAILDQLLKQLNKSDFGMFVFAADDKVTIGTQEYSAPRDNVIFELGLFVGKLGIERSYFVVPHSRDGTPPVRVLSDLGGIVYGHFDPERAKHDPRGALAAACIEAEHRMRDCGPIDRPPPIEGILVGINEKMDRLLSSRELFAQPSIKALGSPHKPSRKELNRGAKAPTKGIKRR